MAYIFNIIFCLAVIIANSGADQTFRELDWWENTLIYQIYPRSFQDSNGDGYGDLNGITERLDYVKEIGVETVWIQPIYKSPMTDLGYDVADYRAIDPLFGNMDDFKKLLKGIHDRGMKLILDFVPNHTSDLSEWFKLSVQRVEPYTDFYVWRDAKKINDTHSTYPNNWRSVFGGSAWKWNEQRKQYYLHQFTEGQVELDFRNPRVRTEIENVLKFWLDLGVDGFRVDALGYVYEEEHFLDEPFVREARGDETDYVTLDHIYTISQPENSGLVKSWRAMLDDYSKKDGQTRLLCIEDYGWPILLRSHLGNETIPGAQISFYVRLAWMDFEANAPELDIWIHNMTDVFPAPNYNWVLDNHDNNRVSSRYQPESVDAWNMLALLLPGVASIYYGSELGMQDIKPRKEQRQDPGNQGNGRTGTRDGPRGPMMWDDTRNAGFTTAKKPWLPVNPNYWETNVEAQRRDHGSHLNIYKRLVALRRTHVIRYGDLNTYVPKDWVYMFTRSIDTEKIAVLMNIGSETEEVCAKYSANHLPEIMYVHTSSINSGLGIGDKVKTFDSDESKCIRMRPFSGLVLSSIAQSHNFASRSSYSIIILLLVTCFKILI
ncbi:unnamed protein product [Bemisia tabaci]|uniref:alpha-glucosidase n=1 Tax=Bemisia tabaci TaxID=7038 RepID=A0A9P0F599_BEMTA|nr:unnamed protein product [Bemisia tabaci]